MTERTTYHPFAKFLHWTIVILIALQFLSSWLMPEGRRIADTVSVFTTSHISFGLLVIPIAVVLVFMHFFKPVKKEDEKEMSREMKLAAGAMHWTLYILLVLVPISGWAAASERSMDATIFNLINLPTLAVGASSILHTLGRMHSLLADLIGFLAIGHILAALYHHFMLRDDVLIRMSPLHKKKMKMEI